MNTAHLLKGIPPFLLHEDPQKKLVSEESAKYIEIELDRIFAALYREKGVSVKKQLISDTCLMF